MAPVSTTINKKKDIRWTDAQIRWPEDEVAPEEVEEDDDEDGDDNDNPFDPFADPDPHEIFSFRFVVPKQKSTIATTSIETDNDDDDDNDDNDDEKNDTEIIRLDIHGYKTESDAVWQSTGLTLWKASKYLCDYMVQHADELQGQRVLEVSG